MAKILGIDPGRYGAAALMVDGAPTWAAPMPVLQTTKSTGRAKTELDLARLRDLLDGLPADTQIVVERVGHRPGDGAAGSFTFGYGAGQLDALIFACRRPRTYVTPAVWSKALGMSAGPDAPLVRASELWPRSTELWTPKRLERTEEQCRGIADAFLIAEWFHRRMRVC